jgi:phage N-6-adenine-methyltransferase
MSKVGPTINRGSSRQDYETPDDFIQAVEARFGKLDFDLAASAENTKAPLFYTEEDNSLARRWDDLEGNLWLNPPFTDIGAWAGKCCMTKLSPQTRILFLVPASVGSEWYRLYVHDRAYVLTLSPRLTFKGCKDPYPKDMLLAVFNGPKLSGFEPWRWDKKLDK